MLGNSLAAVLEVEAADVALCGDGDPAEFAIDEFQPARLNLLLLLALCALRKHIVTSIVGRGRSPVGALLADDPEVE